MNSENWRSCLLSPEASMGEAVACLDRSGLQIALLVDGEDQLVGTITDGDIRRGLLRGLDLTTPAVEVAQTTPLVVPPDLDHAAVLQIMRANKIHQLPVVTEDRRLVGLQVWDVLGAMPERSNWMIVMAGGKGMRLRPFTEDCPKPMLEIGGKPMLEHIVTRARDEGIRRFVLAIGYLGHMIEDHFGDGSPLSVEIEYLREQEPLGTGGALSLLEAIPNEPFLVTNGDVLTDVSYCDLLDYHRHHDAMATMAVRSFEWQHPFGIVQTDGISICGFEEKPILRSHVNAGIYVMSPAALDCLEPGQPCDMPTLFNRLRAAGRQTIVFPIHEPWMDIGRPDDLQNARDSYAI
jgi:dTDP-glucose pyrophosphorylase